MRAVMRSAVCWCAVSAVMAGTAGARPLPASSPARADATGGQRSAPPAGLPVTRLDERPRSADLDGIRAISLSISDPLPVRDVVMMLFRGSAFSVVFESGVSGTFIGELSDLTLRQALEAVLVSASLDYSLGGTVLRVFPRRPETRLFGIDHPAVRRELRRRVGSRDDVNGTLPSTRLITSGRAELFDELGGGVQALLSPGGRYHLDRQAGLLQVTDFADRLSQVGVYVETVLARAARQVRLHARVLEVTLTGTAVVDWPALIARAGAAVAQVSGPGLRITDFDALIRAIGTAGQVRVIAAPQMLAMNNQPAFMRVGSATAAFLPETAASSAEGLALTITPHITADGVVQMSVAPSLFDAAPSASGRSAAVVETDSVMRVRDGDTVIVSGLVRESAVSLPIESGGRRGIPGEARVRKELILLITPTIVGGAAAPRDGAAARQGPQSQ